MGNTMEKKHAYYPKSYSREEQSITPRMRLVTPFWQGP